MKCFNHHELDAVGLCKHCQRALCEQCVTDLGHGLACKNRHEDDVEAINNLIENNKKTYEAQPKGSLIMPIFYVFMGLVFVYFAYKDGRGIGSMPFIMGAGFILFGIAIFAYNQLYLGKIRTKYHDDA